MFSLLSWHCLPCLTGHAAGCKYDTMDKLELEYRKKHFKKARDVLSSSILCAICKTDLKQNIILNKNILVHKTFLCLCCENCFEQLSHFQNGCIFCYGKTNLKVCEMCDGKMCKKCVDGFMGSANINRLNKCLKCCPRWLWSQRSQAADVLKCFSLELDTRLLVSGEESEEKQNVVKFLISTAKCNENLCQEAIDRRRVKLLCDSFNSKIEMSLSNLKNKETQEIKNQFNKVCDQILVDTCKVVLDLKCFFDQNNNGHLNTFNNKIKALLRVDNLFQKTEKDDKSLESSQSKKCLVKHYKHTDIEQNVAEASNSVSDNLKLNTEFKLKTFENTKMNIGRKTEGKLNNTDIEHNIVKASNSVNNNLNPILKLERLTIKNTNGHIRPNSQRNFKNTDVKQNVAEESNTVHDKLNLIPIVKLEFLNIENTNTYIPPQSKRKLTNTSIEKNVVEASNSVNNKINLIPFVKLERLNIKYIPPKSKRKLNNTDIEQNIVKASNLVNQTRSEVFDVKNMHEHSRRKSNRKTSNRVIRLGFPEALNSVNQTQSERFNKKNMNDHIRRKSKRKLNNTDIEQNLAEASNTVKDKLNLIPVVELERLEMKNMNNCVLPKRSNRKLNRKLVNKNTDEKTDTLVKKNEDVTIEGTSPSSSKKKCRIM